MSRAGAEAAVWVGGEETPYRRGGDGAPVLLLLPGAGAGEGGLFAVLAAEFRVIAPLRLPRYGGPGGPGGPVGDGVGGAASPWESWLRGLIDGLGLGRPPLVVDAALVAEVERCSRVDPGRIRAVLPAGPDAASIVAALRALVRDD